MDVLFVDEAGQMSLANALAVSGAAGSLVLLGDPQQLEQPQKGSHPDGVGVSALEHVLGGAATMPPDRGLFLPTTWRLHPAICAFTSELFYEGKLEPKPASSASARRAPAPSTARACGGCPSRTTATRTRRWRRSTPSSASSSSLLGSGPGLQPWLDRRRRDVLVLCSPPDLLVVAPYNAQVNRLTERLGRSGVPVGTVDKFQGQEAPVVIYSMARRGPRTRRAGWSSSTASTG